jgi:hypothetical protein
MTATLVQSASATVIKGESYTANVTFEETTKPGSLIVLILVAAGGLPVWEIPDVPGYTLIRTRGLRDLQLTAWYRFNAPPSVSVSIWGKTYRSLQLRALEYSGVAQAAALDKVITFEDESRNVRSGSTGNISNADSLAIAVVANQYASTAQGGFLGGLVKLFEDTSPREKGRRTNEDWERSRVTVHQGLTVAIQSFSFFASLSTSRRWICFLLVFKGGTTGPAKLTSINTAIPICANSGRGQLSAFGPLRATAAKAKKAMSSNPSAGAVARIAPFDYQYRLGGYSGFLVGSGTVYKVEGTDGLNGWNVRTSDSDIPRGDGSLRGIDLESAREFTMRINVGRNRDEIELFLDRLYRALVPRRDEDYEMIWRHPTQPPKMMRIRPISLPRLRNSVTNQSYANQSITFRASDPRHYSAVVNRVELLNTPANALTPTELNVSNIGNVDAYPVITIQGPDTNIPVTNIQINNKSTLGAFNLQLVLPRGSTMIADMEARVTGAQRSVITLDGEPRYGAWQLPREPFVISSDPTGLGGFNVLTMETVPAGAPVKAVIEYRHTWSG